jgi:hypothetical protein
MPASSERFSAQDAKRELAGRGTRKRQSVAEFHGAKLSRSGPANPEGRNNLGGTSIIKKI